MAEMVGVPLSTQTARSVYLTGRCGGLQVRFSQLASVAAGSTCVPSRAMGTSPFCLVGLG